MHPLHITRVAVGCSSIDMLCAQIEARAVDGEVALPTRYRPKRAEELVGGSLYWIIKHRLAARQRIIGFGESKDGQRCIIRLEARLVPVLPQPKRAHQGWRYLAGADAPEDHDGSKAELADMPERLIDELSSLGLI